MLKRAIILILLFSNSVFSKSGKVTITGKIENNSLEKISISYINNRELIASKVNEKGVFEIKTKIENGYYILNYGRNTAFIYLYPKDDMQITFDAKDFQKSLKFEGEGSSRNNYLIIKSLQNLKITEDLNAFYKVDEKQFIKNLNSLKESNLELLSTSNLSDYFTKDEKKSLEYERLLSIKNYVSNYKFYLGDEITVSDSFYSPLNSLNYNIQSDYKTQPYYRFLVNSYWSDKLDDAENVDKMIQVLRRVPSQEIAITLINGCLSKMSKHKERAEDYLNLIKKVTTHKPFLEYAEKTYKEVLNVAKLAKGENSPKFSYENLEGKIVKLDDFKGKYIYIDVWATWCAPCIKQVPYLKKLEKKYHDKDIVFISISVDKENLKETWKQFVVKKGLGGVQLFADKSFDSEFMNAYAVNSIPRFIIIDPKGNIVDAEAPRPSFEKTSQLLDNLLNK